jgi:hypothetical protein
MSEYIPIYQSQISITHSLPALESAFGNQTLEFSVLQDSELLEADLGNPVLNECSLEDMLIFWFTFGNRWFRFHLPEYQLDSVTSSKTSKFAFFLHQGLNIYKLYLRINGYDKLIYFPKNLIIENYSGIIKELDDHTFYLSADPTGKVITGLYDVPVIFENKSLTLNSNKEDRISNIRIKEILFGEEITPPIPLGHLQSPGSIIGGLLGSITPPVVVTPVTPNNLTGGLRLLSSTGGDNPGSNYVGAAGVSTGVGGDVPPPRPYPPGGTTGAAYSATYKLYRNGTVVDTGPINFVGPLIGFEYPGSPVGNAYPSVRVLAGTPPVYSVSIQGLNLFFNPVWVLGNIVITRTDGGVDPQFY